MLISADYAAEQKALHTREAAYGSRGFNWGYLIAGIATIERCTTILDYGCGKGTLGKTLRNAGLKAFDYDPGVTGKEKQPDPADLVASVDVLEHIEPNHLDHVLVHMAALTMRCLFVAISTIPAKRWLSDGRNTHLIVQGGDWWRMQFERHGFTVRREWKTGIPEWVALMNGVSRAA